MTQLHILQDLIVIFAAGLVVVLVLSRLRLPTIAGYIVAGALLGPSGFGWVTDSHEIEQLAEIGVVLLNDPSATLRAVRAARRLAPETPIAARARYVADVPTLLQAGATDAVAQEFEASLEVIRRVMKPDPSGETAGATAVEGRLPPGLGVESLPVRDDDWIVGRTLAEAQLRARTGATLVAISRGDDTAVHPSPEDGFDTGDVVCLVGDEEQIAAARALLAEGPRS